MQPACLPTSSSQSHPTWYPQAPSCHQHQFVFYGSSMGLNTTDPTHGDRNLHPNKTAFTTELSRHRNGSLEDLSHSAPQNQGNHQLNLKSG